MNITNLHLADLIGMEIALHTAIAILQNEERDSTDMLVEVVQ